MSEAYLQTAGWDIGGAHVKLAFVEHRELITHQWHCPLWKGIGKLVSVLQVATKILPKSILNHHVTMTGELVDIFSSHEEGVKEIVNIFIKYAGSEANSFFYSSEGLLSYQRALQDYNKVASVNWIASAKAVSQNSHNTIFIDIGSTTSDILHIDGSGLVLNGLTDYQRLITGELVYTGVVRSCVNTICNEIPYNNNWVPLMAELFSNAADVYRVLEWLPDHADYGDTMDGCEKDKPSSMRRLARMIGREYNLDDEEEWCKACGYIADQQMMKVEKSILPIMKMNPKVKSIVGAGVGAFLVKKIAQRLHLNYVDFSQCVLPQTITYQAISSDCAPAVALLFISKTNN